MTFSFRLQNLELISPLLSSVGLTSYPTLSRQSAYNEGLNRMDHSQEFHSDFQNLFSVKKT